MADADEAALWRQLRAAAGTGQVVDVTLVHREDGGVRTREHIGRVVVHSVDRRRRAAGWIEVANVSREGDREGVFVLHRIVERRGA